jgi:hypothetical protein
MGAEQSRDASGAMGVASDDERPLERMLTIVDPVVRACHCASPGAKPGRGGRDSR